MGRRDSMYLLKDMVGYDESFVEVVTKNHIKTQLMGWKGNQRQVLVGIVAESSPLENPESVKRNKNCGLYKMQVLAKADSENVNQFIRRNLDGDVVLFTDRNTA